MKMLRYMLVVVAALVVVEASAWTTEVNKAIMLLAEEHLSGKAKRSVESTLGMPLHQIEFANKGKSCTRLNEQGKSVTTDATDAVVKLEKAITVLESKNATAEERKVALLTAVEMTVDLHCPANVLIDKYLEEDFTFGRDNGRPKKSRWFKIDNMGWQSMWHSDYHTSHGAFSAEMYLYDWQIATKGMIKGFNKEKIAPRKWAEQTGEVVFEALKVFKPEAVVNRIEITIREDANDMAMCRAAFRLANLLNNRL